MPAPAAGTYPAYFGRYITLVDANSVAEAIEKYSSAIINFVKDIPIEKVDYILDFD